MNGTGWVRVDASNPCPVCNKGDWCRVTADGALAGCMRVETGCFKSKEGQDGSRVFLHRLTNGPRHRADAKRPPVAAVKRAEPERLHAVYSALLGCLTLSEGHRKALRDRGLPEEAIERGGYRTLPKQGRSRIVRNLHERLGDDLLRVPGFVVKEGRSESYVTLCGPVGLIVPCRDQSGRIVALKVRGDDPGEVRPRYVYCSSAGHGGPGPGAPVHCPTGTPEAAEVVRLTEGELKADIILALTELPTLSIPGAGNWRPALPVLKALGCKTVRLAFDADANHKPEVARPLLDCAETLATEGYAVEIERWDEADGKGLDDLLVAGKKPRLATGDAALSAVREVLAEAMADGEPAPLDTLRRLQEALDEEDPAALFRDKPLLQALADMATTDPAGFAAVRASIRGRVSVRDLDKALRPFRRSPAQTAEASAYFEQDGFTYRNTPTKDGLVPVALCNFTARIVEEVCHDDGVEQTLTLAVEGTLVGGQPLPRVEVPAGDFAGMGWTVPAWGTRAVIYAGMGTKDHLRVALQLLSGDVPRRTIYRHTGWRKIGECWFYLHAAGGIGSDGLNSDISVTLPEPLAGFRLPTPLEGMDLADAVRASLGLLQIGPDRTTFPLLAAVYRAVLGSTDFSPYLAGPTGSFKTEAAALAQQHFGAGMDARHLPASWSSTGNALEGLAFVAKDALLVVDDFCPSGSSADVQRYHKEADRLIRGQGNQAGRQRMRADASLRPAKSPRGMTLSTGEDVPHGQSLRARLLVLEISKGDFGPQPPELNPILSSCQRDAASGKYAAALSGFLRWLAPQLDDVRGRLRTEWTELRDRASSVGQHARTPGIVADLALGLRYFLDFAQATGAISEQERTGLWDRGLSALEEAAAAQAAQLAVEEPAGRFLRLLRAALASGHAHVADRDGYAPNEPQRWGWRGEGLETRPQGKRVGWLLDGELYLEPEASFAAVQLFARDQNESFPITAATLRRRLKEKGALASTDAGRKKLTVRKTLQGERREVLHVTFNTGASAPRPDPADRDREEEDRSGLLIEVPAGTGEANGEAGHAMATNGRSWGEWQ